MFLEYFNQIIDIFLLNPIAQTSGFLGMICVWIAFLYKDDLKTIKILFIASIFWWLQYLLLESYAGLLATIIWALRLYLSMKYKKNIKVFIFMIIVIAITWVISFKDNYSLLPILWSLIWAYSFFFFSWIILRIWCLSISIIWLIYGIHIWSIWWVINEVVVEILILFAIYNYIWVNWYRLLYVSKIKSIFQPYREIDYWHYTIVKDKNKIFKTHSLKEQIKDFITKIKSFFTKINLK